MNNNPKLNTNIDKSKPYAQMVDMDSSLTTAYRNPLAGNFYQWYGHEQLHHHVTRQAVRAEPIHEPDVLRFIERAYPFNQTRAKKPSVEEFKQFYAKQRKRLLDLRKDIEKCASPLAPVKPTYIVIKPPGYSRKKRYTIVLYTTPNDDITSWTEEVANYNKRMPWSRVVRITGVKHYADFMKSLNDNIDYLANLDPTPHVEKHLSANKAKQQLRSVSAAQSIIKDNLQKIAGHEADLRCWSDSEYIREHAAKQRLYHVKNMEEATERVKEHVKRLVEHGVELTEEQQSFVSEVTE